MTPGRPALADVDLDRLDLFDPALHASHDLTPVWRMLRRYDPVRWQPVTGPAKVPGVWVVTRYADLVRVLRDSETFTPVHGNMLGTLLRGHDPGAHRMLVVSDGRYHAGLRSLLSRGFGPRALEPVTRAVAAATRDLLSRMLARGGGDFATEVAAQVPLGAICDLLAVPEPDRSTVLELTSAAMLGQDTADVALDARIAQSEILLYYTRLVAERRAAPGRDIISVLANGTVDGRRLTEDEVLLNCYNLIIGGDETARLALAGGLLALAHHPDQWHRLRAEAALVHSGTEEILRWTTPAAHVGRTVRHATTLHGRALAAGDAVTLWTVSANRDEEVFDDPDRFDIARQPNRHLTFGHGAHFCLGAQLARVEVRALLHELRTTVRDIDITGPVSHIPSTFICGVRSLPVRLTPR